MKIFLIGFMGAGKSYWGRLLAGSLQLPYYDLDEVIMQEEGKGVAEIFAEKGEEYFRQKENEKLRELARSDRFIISCGGGTPCFGDNMPFMNAAGLTVWLNPPIDVMVERLLRKRHKRPLLKDLNDEELRSFVERKLEERRPFYGQSRIIIDSANESVHTFTEKLLHA